MLLSSSVFSASETGTIMPKMNYKRIEKNNYNNCKKWKKRKKEKIRKKKICLW